MRVSEKALDILRARGPTVSQYPEEFLSDTPPEYPEQKKKASRSACLAQTPTSLRRRFLNVLIGIVEVTGSGNGTISPARSSAHRDLTTTLTRT